MNEITDKTYCIITNYGNKLYITEEQYRQIYNNFDKLESIKIKNQGIINKKYVVMIAKASEIIEEDKKRQGMWKCRYGYWHKKGEECGHNNIKNKWTKK